MHVSGKEAIVARVMASKLVVGFLVLTIGVSELKVTTKTLVAGAIAKISVAKATIVTAFILAIVIHKKVTKIRANFLTILAVGSYLCNSFSDCSFNRSSDLSCNLAYYASYYHY